MFNRDLIYTNGALVGYNWNDINEVETSCFWASNYTTAVPKRSCIFILPDKMRVDISGKVFKWYSSPKVWRFLVHYSHQSNVVFNTPIFFFKKVGKNRYIIFSKRRVYTQLLRSVFRYVRQSDLFTGRGVKYTPRKYFKKQGKISTYV